MIGTASFAGRSCQLSNQRVDKRALAGGSVETGVGDLCSSDLQPLHHERLQDGAVNALMCNALSQPAIWQNSTGQQAHMRTQASRRSYVFLLPLLRCIVQCTIRQHPPGTR